MIRGELASHSAVFEGCLNNARYACGNVCKDEDVMKQRALHETLNRLLWRASIIARDSVKSWNHFNKHHYIYFDKDSDSLKVGYNDIWKSQGTCYFPTKKSAEDAIKNIIKPFMKEHPDFVW